MGYFFPMAGVFVTAMPKTGCTTVLNLMVAVEERLAQGEMSNEPLHVPDDWWTIHGTRKEVYAQHWAAPRPDDAISVVVVRNPVDRLFSAWSDKFLLCRDPSLYWVHRDAPWYPTNVESVSDVRGMFIRFVEALEASEEFLNADPHWKPQDAQVEGHPPYTVVLNTEELGDLLTVIADAQPRLNWIRTTPVPRLHSSDVGAFGVVTADVVARIEALYRGDVELLERLGVAYPSLAAADTTPPDVESIRATAQHWSQEWLRQETQG